MYSELHHLAPVPDGCLGLDPPKGAGGGAHVRFGSQQRQDRGLLVLDEQVRANAGEKRVQRLALYHPSVRRPPAPISSAHRAKNATTGDFLASDKEGWIAARGADLRGIECLASILPRFANLEGSLALKKPGEPCPFQRVFHARIATIFGGARHPEYTAIATRRLSQDAGMFAEVLAA